MPAGFGTAFTYNFQKYFGLEGDFGTNWDNYETTISTGPKLSLPDATSANLFLAYFVELQPARRRRPAQGQWHRRNSRRRHGTCASTRMVLSADVRGGLRMGPAKLLLGRVRRHSPIFGESRSRACGCAPAWCLTLDILRLVTPTRSCSVQPSEVMVGEPITATAATTNFNPKHTLNYAWSGYWRKSYRQGQYRQHRHQRSCRRQLHRHRAHHRSQKEDWRRGHLYRELHGEGTAQESADHVVLG